LTLLQILTKTDALDLIMMSRQ